MFEAKYPDDNRPRKSIEVSRRFAMDSATAEELESERYAAAESAVRSAARSAAWCAVLYAGYTADTAARSAAWFASSCAASCAAKSASRAASRAAGNDEQKQQIKIIESYLEGDDEYNNSFRSVGHSVLLARGE